MVYQAIDLSGLKSLEKLTLRFTSHPSSKNCPHPSIVPIFVAILSRAPPSLRHIVLGMPIWLLDDDAKRATLNDNLLPVWEGLSKSKLQSVTIRSYVGSEEDEMVASVVRAVAEEGAVRWKTVNVRAEARYMKSY